MMGRFVIDESLVVAWVSPSAQRANAAAAAAASAPQVERRSASRPWSKAPARAVDEQDFEAAAPKKVVGGASSDSEWEEF
jgi:hypothetical protein